MASPPFPVLTDTHPSPQTTTKHTCTRLRLSRKATVALVPTASALVIKALKEPVRDRKKEKNSALQPFFFFFCFALLSCLVLHAHFCMGVLFFSGSALSFPPCFSPANLCVLLLFSCTRRQRDVPGHLRDRKGHAWPIHGKEDGRHSQGRIACPSLSFRARACVCGVPCLCLCFVLFQQ